MGNDMSDLEEKVLKAIAAKNLKPRPAWVFLARRSVFWGLAVLSILLGGVTFTILLFVVADYYRSDWRNLDNIHYNEVLAIVPVVWLIILALFTASAAFGLRQTRRGYRFRPRHVGALALLVSLGVGIVLYDVDAARKLHEMLALRFPVYRSFTYVPFAEWSRPEQGYLGGTVLAGPVAGIIRLQDFHDNIWAVDISAAQIVLDQAIGEAGDVAIRGHETGPGAFRALIISEFD